MASVHGILKNGDVGTPWTTQTSDHAIQTAGALEPDGGRQVEVPLNECAQVEAGPRPLHRVAGDDLGGGLQWPRIGEGLGVGEQARQLDVVVMAPSSRPAAGRLPSAVSAPG